MLDASIDREWLTGCKRASCVDLVRPRSLGARVADDRRRSLGFIKHIGRDRHQPGRGSLQVSVEEVVKAAPETQSAGVASHGGFIGGTSLDSFDGEDHLRCLEEFNPQVQWIGDGQGNIIRISQRWKALTGQPPEQALGSGWHAFVHPDDRPAASTTMQQSLANRTFYDIRFRALMAGGGYRWFRTRGYPKLGGRGQIVCVYGFTEDVHDQVMAEERLRDSEQHLRHTLEHLPYMPWTADPDGNILEPHPEWARRTGRPIDEAVGHGWLSAVHPDDHASTLRAMQVARDTGEPYRATYRVRMADGAYRWVQSQAYPRRDESGRIVQWYGINSDIHERVIAEEQLRESEENHRYAVELNPQIPWIADPAGNILDGGPRWQELVGASIDEALGTGWVNSIHPNDVKGALDKWEQALKTGEAFDARFRIRMRDGSWRWFRSRARARRNGSGDIVRWYGTVEDIDDQIVAELALRQSEALNRSIVEASTDCVELLDLEGNLLFINGPGKAAMEIDDFEALCGTSWVAVWPEEVRRDVERALKAARAGGVGRFSTLCPTAKGEPRWWDVVVSPVLGDDGHPIKLVGISRDMTQQKLVEDRVRWSAEHDQLTELPNRRVFHARLQQALAAAKLSTKLVGLLALDVDRFKEVNDTIGHDAGDFLLKVFSARLSDAVRSTDTVARLGGDEFAVILPDLASAGDVAPIAEAILARLREPIAYKGRLLDCRASIGGSVSILHAHDDADLLKCADTALYTAKSTGRGRFVLFENSMRSTQQIRSSMISIAREALNGNHVVPFYQPKIDLSTGKVIGFEALLRWVQEGRGIQLPGQIAAAFEDPDLGPVIGSRILEGVTADMQQWRDQGLDFGHVAVNASAMELRNPHYAKQVLSRLLSTNIPPQWLEVEVTESVVLGRSADTVETTLRALSNAGVSISLDDFGTGYASLAHLRRFPVNAIKIDRSFVGDFRTDASNGAIARAVINLGRGLGIRVVAEGVETEEQAVYLSSHGCDVGQGFLFGRPMPASEVVDAVRSPLRLNLGNTYITSCSSSARCNAPRCELVNDACCVAAI
jgi:diguanylate cyclase (GGDEF)-like protein/PAS domain S-box-containing protein